MQEKSLTLGETLPEVITPDSDYNALSSVTVSVNGSIIKPENIKSGVTILGVQGALYGLNKGSWYLTHSETDTGDGYYTVLETIASAGGEIGSTALIWQNTLKSWYNKYGSKTGALLIVHSSTGHKVGDKFNFSGWAT